jgi:hypothetical protein
VRDSSSANRNSSPVIRESTRITPGSSRVIREYPSAQDNSGSSRVAAPRREQPTTSQAATASRPASDGGSRVTSSGERTRITPNSRAMQEPNPASGSGNTRASVAVPRGSNGNGNGIGNAYGIGNGNASNGDRGSDRRRLTPNSSIVDSTRMAARPRGNDYGYTGLKAVPRHANDPNWSHGYYYPKRSHYIAPPHHYYYNHYYYYPHYHYPYGYGAWGLGYFYYDPYAWAPVAHIHYDGYSYGYGYGYSTGELRLQVRPNFAEVYVDGYYAGQVDEFDGSFQSLRLEEGEYHIEIMAAGYDTIAFDVRIQPGRKINYRGELFAELQP